MTGLRRHPVYQITALVSSAGLVVDRCHPTLTEPIVSPEAWKPQRLMEETHMLSNGRRPTRTAGGLFSITAVVASVSVGVGPAWATTAACSISGLSTSKGSTAGGTGVLISGRGFLNVDTTSVGSVK